MKKICDRAKFFVHVRHFKKSSFFFNFFLVERLDYDCFNFRLVLVVVWRFLEINLNFMLIRRFFMYFADFWANFCDFLTIV